MKKILLFIFITNSLFSKMELILQDARHSGRWGFECLDSNDCYAITSGNEVDIFHSKDKGVTWNLLKNILKKELDPPVLNPFIELSYVLDSNHIYFIDDWEGNSYFYTNDGFETIQSKKICRFGNRPVGFIMIDSLKGLISNGPMIFRTFDGWDTWDSTYYGNDTTSFRTFKQKNDSIFYFSGKKIYNEESNYKRHIFLEYNFYTEELNILYEFPKQLTTSNNFAFLFLEFISDDIAFTGGSYSDNNPNDNQTDIIYKTTDGGKSWYTVLDEFNCCFSIRDMAFRDENYGITVEANKYYETFDGGETWHYGFFDTPDGEPLHVTCQVEFAGDRCLIGSLGKGMYAWEEIKVSVEEQADKNIMVWNGGNSLRIGSDQNNLEIVIFDLLGNQIHSEIFNKNTIIDLSEYPSASYVFHILQGGAVVRSGKFVKQ